MAGVDVNALINSLTEGMTVLHTHDQKLQLLLRRIQATRTVSHEDFESLLEAQRAGLRVPANALLMFAGFIEQMTREAEWAQPTPPSVPTRARRAVRVLLGRE